MFIKKLTFLFLFIQTLCFSQTLVQPTDSVSKKRILLVNTSLGIGALSSLIALQQVWYADYPKSKIHSFNDSKNWMGMDKLGHVYTCYTLSKVTSSFYSWSGVPKKKAAIYGSCFSWGYQFVLELMDGKSSAWGFSWADLASNTSGALLYSSQEILFKKQWIKMKFSYFPSKYPVYRPDVLGSNWSEQLLKDYNAQIYWLSISPTSYTSNKKISWFGLALGYSADAKLVGDNDFYMHTTGEKFFAQKEFFMALDLHLSNFDIKRKWIKALLSPFEMVKIPLPGLCWRNGICYVGLY